MSADRPERDRLLELLADRAMEPLSAEDAAEVARGIETAGPAAAEDDAALERAAAALAIACLGSRVEAMPSELASRIARRGREIVASTPREAEGRPRSTAPPLRREESPLRSSLGWYVAAAALLLAAASLWPRLLEWVDVRTPERDRAELIATAPDLVRGEWSPMKEFEGRNITGTCEWSDALQSGFLAFRGLPPNAAEREQYQLWILVPDQKHPIDGGVFDGRPTDGGELVIPVDPKLGVAAPTAFAVTIEKKGGVVVSDQSRLVLLASLSR